VAIQRTTVTVTPAAGGAGVATLSAVSSQIVDGVILGVHLTYTDSPPSTTDITIAEKNNSPAMPILTVTDANTNGWFPVLAQAVNQAAAAITGMGAPIGVSDYVNVTIAQANNGDGVVAVIVWDDGR
jgi:hypothetical protein